jgi:hypothetical protein
VGRPPSTPAAGVVLSDVPFYDSSTEGLAGTGLESINDTGSRWSMPVVATLRFRF